MTVTLMFQTPTTSFEEKEDSRFAPYAVKHSLSGGRISEEKPQEERTCFQRDRDRIIHSKAFRRLGYKTQVFVNSEGDMFRTRLTHSLEVAQLSRSAASYLGLNADYCETIALAHDMGHSPFGHAGQDILNRLMANHGGFEHNCQTLRIVSALETRTIDWNGLNLTRLSLIGMMKHVRIYECDTALREILDYRRNISPPLEAVLVDTCDRLAYLHHDFEDGLDSGFLDRAEVLSHPAFLHAQRTLQDRHGSGFSDARFPLRARMMVHLLIHEAVSDLVKTTQQNLFELRPEKLEDIFALDRTRQPVSNSEEMKSRLALMQKFLYAKLYRHPSVLRMSRRGEKIIENLFREYTTNPGMMPDHYVARVETDGVERVAADYISGMTDRFAEQDNSYLQGG